MKRYLSRALYEYPTLFSCEVEVLEHLFCTIGNGLSLDKDGYIIGSIDESSYKDKEVEIGKLPILPLQHIYPFSNNYSFAKFKGCKEIGFKKAVEYFIECLKVTPDIVENAKEWKDNIGLIKEILLG